MGNVADDPAREGQLLRQALTDHVSFAKKTRAFRRHGKHVFIEVDKIFERYLPEGCTFDYAENVLRSAGFDLDPRPNPAAPGMFGGDVNACSESFEGAQCFVALRPPAPYDYSRVHRVIACCGGTWLFSSTEK